MIIKMSLDITNQFTTLNVLWDSINLTSVFVFLSIYVYIYWSQRGIKTPRPIPWFGTAHYPLLTPKPELELNLHRTYGRIYGLYDGFLGTNPTLVCGHPEAIKEVTIKHFDHFTNRRRPATWKSIRYRALTYLRDEEWREMRRILAPTFTGSKLRRMFELMKQCTRNLVLSIEYQGKGENEIDLKRVFSVFTVDIISTCCFSMDLKDFRNPESEMLISARKFFNVSRPKMAFSMALPKSLLAISGFDINDNSSIEFFARFAQQVINTRRKYASLTPLTAAANNANFKKKEDFLQILIDAAAEFNSQKTTSTSKTTTTTHDNISNNNNSDNNNDIEPNKQTTKFLEQDVKEKRQLQNKCVPEQRSERQTRSIQADSQNQHDLYDFNDNNYHDLDDDNTTTATRIPKNPQNAARFSERQLGDLEILAQSMLFFAVGHETTATLLSSCGLFLSLHPDLQERLYAEVHEAFEAEKKSQSQGISYERLMELQYLDAFISEALRYFTPTLNFDREASEDVEIEVEGKRILIPKGMGVVIPFHAVHHDPLNYEDPERFDPERFMPQNKDKIKPCTFIPFGSGPRYCLASRFALIEAKLALATLVNRFRFVRSEGTIWPPKYRHHYMLLQMEWPKIRFVDRTLDSNILGSNGRAQMAA